MITDESFKYFVYWRVEGYWSTRARITLIQLNVEGLTKAKCKIIEHL